MVEAINNTPADKEFDLAIIGGGIIGMCTAWYAARHYPQWRIAVFEQNNVGSGATQYSASLDLPYGHTPLRHQLAKRSGELYTALRKELPLPIRDLPFYGIVDKENANRVLAQITDANAKISPEKAIELSSIYPDLLLSNNKTIIAGGTASYATQNNIAKIIGSYFINQQHSIFEHTAIKSIALHHQQYQLYTDTDKRFSAKRIVQATGPWLHPLYNDSSRPMQQVRVKKVVAFHLLQQPAPNDAVLYFFDDDAFLLPKQEDGYWLFSFKCDHWDVMPRADMLQIEEADIIKARSILQQCHPRFVPLCKEGRVFCDAYTQTGDPLIEPLDKGNYVYAGAGCGSGYRLAPAIAESVIALFSKPA